MENASDNAWEKNADVGRLRSKADNNNLDTSGATSCHASWLSFSWSFFNIRVCSRPSKKLSIAHASVIKIFVLRLSDELNSNVSDNLFVKDSMALSY